MTVRRVLLGLLLLLLLGVVSLTLPVVLRQFRINAAIADLAAAGQPTTFADLSSVYAVNAHANPNDATTVLNANADVVAAAQRVMKPLWSDEDFFDRSKPLTAEQRGILLTLTSDHSSAFAAIDKASHCDRMSYTAPLPGTAASILDSLQSETSPRAVARLLHAQTRYLIASEQADAAYESVMTQQRLLHLQKDTPLVVGFMMHAAIVQAHLENVRDLIDRAQLSPEQHERLDQSLARLETMDLFQTALLTERAFGIASHKKLGALGLLQVDLLNYLDWMAEEIQIGTLSQFEEPARRVVPKGLTVSVASSIAPARRTMNEARKQIREVRLLNASQSTADGIELSDDSKTDPFTGERLES
ncbi:MAG: hypothetical protein AAGD07_18980 [Planctomycetota bacterium]